ncbi:MAG: PEP-CTERM sorting domain-containing protein [Acetobacteraceae bacterium]
MNGGSGIYYASSAHALDFVSNTDLGGIFKVLTENGLTEMTHASASAIGSAGGDPGSAGGDPGSAGGDPGFNLGGAAGGSDLYDPMGQKLNSSLGADPAFGTGSYFSDDAALFTTSFSDSNVSVLRIVPIPEPESISLFGAGLVGFGALRRRLRRYPRA